MHTSSIMTEAGGRGNVFFEPIVNILIFYCSSVVGSICKEKCAIISDFSALSLLQFAASSHLGGGQHQLQQREVPAGKRSQLSQSQADL